jgi:signal transduction histidine kinase
MIFGILSTLLVITSYTPGLIVDYTFDNGDKSFSSEGSLVVCTTAVLLFIDILFLLYSLKLYLSSHQEIKKYALLNLIGAIIFGIIPAITMATRLTLVIPGCGFVAASIGAIISTIAFAIQPKLRDVLLEISRDIRIQMRKQLEDQISEKEEQYQSLYTSMSEGVTVNKVIYNDKGEVFDFVIEGVNPAYEKLFKTVKVDAIGLKGSEAYQEYYQIFLERYDIAKTEGKPQVLEISFQKIKKIFFISLFILPKENRFANIFMDVTAERTREEERIKRDKINSIGELAGGVAHGFNNLLLSILGNIQLAKLSNNPNSYDKITGFLNEAQNAAIQGKDLANHFLTFAEGGAPIKKTLSIEKLLRYGAKLPLFGSNVNIDFNIPEDLWLVDCDSGQIQQVINNLIINAKEAMPEGGQIDISASNKHLDEENIPLSSGKYVIIRIKDNGVGIPPENIETIFDPFFSTKPREDQQRMGLGLTITHSIIKRHNGHLKIISKVGVGTTIKIYLPASENQSFD